IQACEDKLGKSFTISTIQKDIKAMKEDEALGFNAPIKFSKSTNGYYYADENYSIKNIKLNENEISSLIASVDLLNTFNGNRISANFNAAIEKVLASVKEHYEKTADRKIIIQLETAPPQRGWQHFDILFKATKENIPVSFIHYNYTTRKFNAIILHPYLLKEFQNHWYVVGYSENHNAIRYFGMDRIMEPMLLKKLFIATNDFNAEQHFSNMYGVYALSKKVETIEFKVNSMLGNYLLSQPLHHSQKVESFYSHGALKLSLQLIPTNELLNYFLMMGKQLKVVSPKWIKEKVQQLHQASFNNYNLHEN
ncbi:MAG: hypothetical protein RIQ33_87, partial [Bacteroidota bacterium]